MVYNSFRVVAAAISPHAELPYEVAQKMCLLRDNYSCRVCGKRRELDTHHIVPRSKCGGHALKNLVTLCRRHHDRVSSGHLEIKFLSKERKPGLGFQVCLYEGKAYEIPWEAVHSDRE